MNANKKWCIAFLAIIVSVLFIVGAANVIVDPYFHYHKPLSNLEYPLDSGRQRYINDGIVRNFDFNALIIGSSMTENFKTSQMNELFGVEAAKVCYMGTTYYEISTNVQKAIDNHEKIEMAVIGLDLTRLCDQSNAVRDDMGTYPTYLYDNNYFNDAEYILNKDVLLEDTYRVIKYTKAGNITTSFDEYSNWMDTAVFGADAVKATYTRTEFAAPDYEALARQQAMIYDNVTLNLVELARNNPDTEFYVFFPPYSICYWDEVYQRGITEWQFDNVKIATELLLECDNVHVYAFFDEYDMVCDLNNYKDMAHYSEEINADILEWMANGEHELTKENNEEYFEMVKQFYLGYDYEALFGR